MAENTRRPTSKEAPRSGDGERRFDADGLVNLLFKSREYFVKELNDFFAHSVPEVGHNPNAYYWHGNQPDIYAAYLFNAAGRPDLTQKWVRWILDVKYGDGDNGLDGNDDGGTLSAWYVLSSLGLFPDGRLRRLPDRQSALETRRDSNGQEPPDDRRRERRSEESLRAESLAQRASRSIAAGSNTRKSPTAERFDLRWDLVQLLDADVAPPHVERLGFLANPVHLERDESARRDRVVQIGGRHAVEPGFDRVAFALNAEGVPLFGLERLAGRLIAFQIDEPATAPLVVQTARPRAGRRIDFDLIAVHASGRNLDGLAAKLDGLGLVEALAADLNARVQSVLHIELQFEDEIRIIVFRAQERIARVRHRRPHNLAVLDTVFRVAAVLHPTFQILPVEEILPTLIRTAGMDGRSHQEKCG